MNTFTALLPYGGRHSMNPEAVHHLSKDQSSKRYTYELLISSINTTPPSPLARSLTNIPRTFIMAYRQDDHDRTPLASDSQANNDAAYEDYMRRYRARNPNSNWEPKTRRMVGPIGNMFPVKDTGKLNEVLTSSTTRGERTNNGGKTSVSRSYQVDRREPRDTRMDPNANARAPIPDMWTATPEARGVDGQSTTGSEPSRIIY
ncbi:hypothetical protein DER44DRAFT_889673 [Fusarium oxysporum]|nr:hypothetical protein DER44DRAFT_889673 [Fusarium oxysporum]